MSDPDRDPWQGAEGSRRARVYNALARLGPTPAAFWVDACRIFNQPQRFDTAAHLLAHVLREVDGALIGLLVPVTDAADGQGVEDEGKRAAKIDAIGSQLHLDLELVMYWSKMSLERLAHRQMVRPRALDDDMLVLFDRYTSLLEAVLNAYPTQFNRWLVVMDKLLAVASPGKKHATRLTTSVPMSTVTLEYFFSRVQAPGWMRPLHDKGLLPGALDSSIDEAGNRHHPLWPQGAYLERMAAIVPRDVAELLATMPPTNNANVNIALVAIARALPAQYGIAIVDAICEGLARADAQVLYSVELAGLVEHLAKGAELDGAAKLLRGTLALRPAPDSFVNDLRGPLEGYHYEELARMGGTALADAGGPGVDVLCNLLDEANRLICGADESPDDLSFIWRPMLDGEPRGPSEIRQALVTAIRDVARDAITSGTATLREVIERLESRRWRIFARLAMYLLAIADTDDEAVTLIADRLGDRQLFDDATVEREYALLLRDRFDRIPDDVRKRIVGWIDGGAPPDLDGWRARWRADHDDDPPDDVQADFTLRWQLRKLWPMRLHLSAERRKFIETEAARFEDVDPLASRERVLRYGSASPLTDDEIATMTVNDLIAFLHSWEPDVGWNQPSSQGLAEAISRVVSRQPESYAPDALQFVATGPTYARALLSGLIEACKVGHPFDWQPSLDAVDSVLEQPRDLDQGFEPFGTDRGWNWARHAATDLLDNALRDGPAVAGADLRERIFTAIRAVIDDPDPTPDPRGPERGSDRPSRIGAAINSIRGKALSAAIHYLGWLHSIGVVERERGSAQAPEAFALIEDRLRAEPSPWVRSIVAYFLPSLVALDADWVWAHADEVFPSYETDPEIRRAAWAAFANVSPFHGYLTHLRPAYVEEIERLDPTAPDVEAADERLGIHLVAYYFGQIIGLGDPLVAGFFARSSPQLRGRILQVFGHGFDARIEQEPMVRALGQELWDWRQLATSGFSENAGPEADAFVDWFRSGALDDAWAVPILVRALQHATKSVYTWRLVERLVEVAESRADLRRDVLRCLVALVPIVEPWELTTGVDDITRILKLALATPELRGGAEDAVNVLLSHGYDAEFRALLR